jgi:hypothetical protein
VIADPQDDIAAMSGKCSNVLLASSAPLCAPKIRPSEGAITDTRI